jgi:hypothetical protein
MTLDGIKKTHHSKRMLVAAIVFLALGVVGIILYATGAPDATGAEANGLGALRGLTIVGAAVCFGVGALLLVLGLIRRKKQDG